MQPYEQGALDGLCGVYSIIHSSRIINDLADTDCQKLFNEVIDYLNKEMNLSKLLIDGLNINIIGEILNNVISLNIKREMPFRGKPETSLPGFWFSMQEFLNNNSNRAVLLGLGGVYDHWSVVNSISDKRINFLDSGGLCYFNRGNCTTKKPDRRRIHQIYPTHTYFLS